jgi:hypothetical protein
VHKDVNIASGEIYHLAFRVSASHKFDEQSERVITQIPSVPKAPFVISCEIGWVTPDYVCSQWGFMETSLNALAYGSERNRTTGSPFHLAGNVCIWPPDYSIRNKLRPLRHGDVIQCVSFTNLQ